MRIIVVYFSVVFSCVWRPTRRRYAVCRGITRTFHILDKYLFKNIGGRYGLAEDAISHDLQAWRLGADCRRETTRFSALVSRSLPPSIPVTSCSVVSPPASWRVARKFRPNVQLTAVASNRGVVTATTSHSWQRSGSPPDTVTALRRDGWSTSGDKIAKK